MRPVTFVRSRAAVLVALTLAVAACTSATPSASLSFPPASEAPASPSPSPTPVPATPAPSPSPTPKVITDQSPVAPTSYADDPVVLEMLRDCGICGPERWFHALPRFRLYADGLAVYRHVEGDVEWPEPYHFVRLDDDAMESLLRYALDEGGLRGADKRYPGDADDAGATTFVLRGWPIDEDVDVEVDVEPVIGNGTTDVYGDPIRDPERRERFARLEELLADFGNWAAERGFERTPYDPGWYSAAIVDPSSGTGGGPWPWDHLAPDAFAPAGWGMALARITTEEAEHAGSGPGGAYLGDLNLGEGRIGSLLIRPILPGDDRPGAHGIRPNTMARTAESGLRVRSLPEISEASVKYEPLLDRGDGLYVIDGPVQGSGYTWYQVYAPRRGLTGWVAAASKTGEIWIEPVVIDCTPGAGPQDIADEVGYHLLRLACYSGVEFNGTYRLAPYPVPNEHELTCSDMEYIDEPAWLNVQLSCFYDFGPEEADTGSYDLPRNGVLHPSLADVPGQLLESSPGGLLVEVRGQLDHPDARKCTSNSSDPAWEAHVQWLCRTTFVITELRAAD